MGLLRHPFGVAVEAETAEIQLLADRLLLLELAVPGRRHQAELLEQRQVAVVAGQLLEHLPALVPLVKSSSQSSRRKE